MGDVQESAGGRLSHQSFPAKGSVNFCDPALDARLDAVRSHFRRGRIATYRSSVFSDELRDTLRSACVVSTDHWGVSLLRVRELSVIIAVAL